MGQHPETAEDCCAAGFQSRLCPLRVRLDQNGVRPAIVHVRFIPKADRRFAVHPGQIANQNGIVFTTLQPFPEPPMTLRDTQESALPTTQKLEFSAAEIGALAHLYRGEVYRSTQRALRPRTWR